MSSKKQLVVKHNRLVEASYRLELAEQRIILFAIKEARETGQGLSSDNFLAVHAADYAAQFNLTTNQAYGQIKEASDTLFGRYIVLHDIDPETGEACMTKARWLSAASYIDGTGTIKLQFSGVIVPYITMLEREFTRYKLESVANMTSIYAIRLYELFMQWGNVGTREIELSWLKRTLVIEESYSAINDLKKRVIDVAVQQINEHSDLKVSYTQRRTGRIITHFIFKFQFKTAQNKRQAIEPTQSEIADLARPGESWEEAAARIRKEKQAASREAPASRSTQQKKPSGPRA